MSMITPSRHDRLIYGAGRNSLRGIEMCFALFAERQYCMEGSFPNCCYDITNRIKSIVTCTCLLLPTWL